MITFIQPDGTIIKSVPDRVYQASNEVSQVILIGGIAQNLIPQIAFKLPQSGVYTSWDAMTPANIPTDIGYSAWTYDLSMGVTSEYGRVDFQIKVEDTQERIVASGLCSFEVEKGVLEQAPDTPPTDLWETIKNLYNIMYGKIINGDLVSKALIEYDSTFAYPLNSVLYDVNSGNFYISLIENNINNSLTDTTKWKEVSFITLDKVENLIEQHNTSTSAHQDIRSEISSIVNGNIIVAKSEHSVSSDEDGSNRNIVDTYQVKKPNGSINLVDENGKLSLIYIPTLVVGAITNFKMLDISSVTLEGDAVSITTPLEVNGEQTGVATIKVPIVTDDGITLTINENKIHISGIELINQIENLSNELDNLNSIKILNKGVLNSTQANVQTTATNYIQTEYGRTPENYDGLIITLTDLQDDKVLYMYSAFSNMWINTGLDGISISDGSYTTKGIVQIQQNSGLIVADGVVSVDTNILATKSSVDLKVTSARSSGGYSYYVNNAGSEVSLVIGSGVNTLAKIGIDTNGDVKIISAGHFSINGGTIDYNPSTDTFTF